MRTVIYKDDGTGKGYTGTETVVAGGLLMALGALVWEIGKSYWIDYQYRKQQQPK